MTHRLECGGIDDCTDMCNCKCHDRCGVATRGWGNQWQRGRTRTAEPCFRLRGHGGEHRRRLNPV